MPRTEPQGPPDTHEGVAGGRRNTGERRAWKLIEVKVSGSEECASDQSLLTNQGSLRQRSVHCIWQIEMSPVTNVIFCCPLYSRCTVIPHLCSAKKSKLLLCLTAKQVGNTDRDQFYILQF